MKKQENITFYAGAELVKRSNITLKKVKRYDSRSHFLTRFLNHYCNNPQVFEQLFWELEKPKTQENEK
jgi:hypothetical protein